jgi:methylated-DNA-[protein]-cysteine S-methyltransferase
MINIGIMKDHNNMNYFSRDTKIGTVTICADKKAVTRLNFGGCSNIIGENLETDVIKKAFIQLDEYLNNSRKTFDINLEYYGTDFQMSVWSALNKIPFGKTKTYKKVAADINRPKSSLAVGAACGKNLIPIFIPCHRVIGSGGNLTGYFGGIDIKRKLLEIEGIII